MIMMTTLGNSFPEVWEKKDSIIQHAYFSSDYNMQREIVNNFKEINDGKGTGAIGRYIAWRNESAQSFSPSALLIIAMRLLEKPVVHNKFPYQIEVTFKFLGKITEKTLLKHIDTIQTTPLLQMFNNQALEVAVNEFILDIDCEYSAEEEELEYEPCPECDGAGFIECQCLGEKRCESCDGAGEYMCLLCHGTGGYRPSSLD